MTPETPDRYEDLTDGLPAWERQPEETATAYAAFCTYRDLGTARTMLAAFRQKTSKKTAKQAAGHWNDWHKKNKWKARAQSYDAHLERLLRAKREATYIKDLDALRERQKKLAQVTLNAAIGLLQKAGERLTNLKPGEIDARTLPTYFRAAASIAEAATNAEATALGLFELITMLDGHEDTR